VALLAVPLAGATTTDIVLSGAALQADGKLVLGGEVSTTLTSTPKNQGGFDVARLNTDSTFGTSGTTVTPVLINSTTYDEAFGLSLQSGGRIILAGLASTGSLSPGPVRACPPRPTISTPAATTSRCIGPPSAPSRSARPPAAPT